MVIEMTKISNYFDEEKEVVDIEKLIEDKFSDISDKLLDNLGVNVLGRTSEEIRKKCKIEKDRAEEVGKLGQELFNFYYNKICSGWPINESMLKHIGIIHREHNDAESDVKFLRDLLLLMTGIIPKRRKALKNHFLNALEQYYYNIIRLAYPPQAGNQADVALSNMDVEELCEGEVKNVKYVGDQIELALKRAIEILKVRPLGRF